MRGIKKYLLDKGSEMPHIGALLQTYFDTHRTYQAALARAIHREPKTLLKYKKNHSLQAAILWEISHALKHNFFADLAVSLPSTFSSNGNAIVEQKDKEIAVLQAEVVRLQQDKELLLRVVQGEKK
jgi:hypothetical protein